MKFLLTSAGIKNTSIHNALVDLLGKPIAESSALCIPTASYALPNGPVLAWRFISGQEPSAPCASWAGSPWACWNSPRCRASMKSFGYPGPGDRRSAGEWRRPLVSVLLDATVRTGRPLAVAARAVYVGLSAGSMVMAPNIGEDFVALDSAHRWR